jgi:hypothetical protein
LHRKVFGDCPLTTLSQSCLLPHRKKVLASAGAEIETDEPESGEPE